MATRLTPQRSAGEKSEARTTAVKKAVANGLAAPARARARKHLPFATIKALTELEVGELSRYANADELFQELGRGSDEMRSTLSPSKPAPTIQSRTETPDRADLNAELARALLKLDFEADDHRRMEELSTKAQKGTLTPEERAEIDEYIRVGYKLAILQSKARLSLERANPPS